MDKERIKKIIFLEAVQDYGGSTISTVELAERLSFQHEVMFLDFYGSCVLFTNELENRGIKLRIIDKRDKPYIINLSTKVFVKLFNYVLFLPHWFKIRKETIKNIKNVNPDFVIINNFKALSALMVFPRKNFEILFFARGWFISAQISRIQKLMLKKWVDKYLCVSQATRQALFCGGLASLENLYVVPNAINEAKIIKEKAAIIKGAHTKIILHAAGFLKDKGQEISLKIAKVLKEEGVDFKLILAGLIYKGHESKNYYNYIKKLIEDFDLENHVELVINKSNVITYFNACDILIHPSETEGLPRVIMEAMILKKPVVANAVGGVTDYIINHYTGFLPQYNSHIEYVHYIKLLIKDADVYKNIADNAYNLIKQTYTEENQLDSLSAIFF